MPSPSHRTPIPLVLDEGIKVASIMHAWDRATAAKPIEGVQCGINQEIPHIIPNGKRLAARVFTLQSVCSWRCAPGEVEHTIVAAGGVEPLDGQPGNDRTRGG